MSNSYFFHFQVDALTAARGEEGGRVIEGVLTQVKHFRVFFFKEIVILTSYRL